MERQLSLKKVDAYLNSLADRHVEINDFVGTSAEELADRIADSVGLASPTLVFFNYTGALDGNQQRTFNNRSLSFSIVFSGINVNDYSAQKEAISKAEEIGLEVLSRINFDSKSPDAKWLYQNFIKESVKYEEVRVSSAEAMYGMDFHFNLRNLEPLVVDPGKWSDGGLVCSASIL